MKRYSERPAEELYDLHADPFELHNLAAAPEQSARLAMLRSELDAWMKQQSDTQTVFGKPLLIGKPATVFPAGDRGRKNSNDTPKPSKE